MSNDTAHYELTINLNEAKSGAKRILIRKDKRLEVTIPAGVSNGSVVKLRGALQITDGIYGDILIHIEVRKHYRQRVFKTFGFWSLILCIPGIFNNTYGFYNPVPNPIFFMSAVTLGILQFRRHFSKLAIAGFTIGLISLIYFGVMVIQEASIPESPLHVYTNGNRELGGNYRPIELINNSNAKNPSWGELVTFIRKDTTDSNLFIETFYWSYVCSDYAEYLHNNAEAAGIRAAWVGIDFEEGDPGHALNAFQTIDKGLVFIDCTSLDTVAYVEKGKELGHIDLDEAYSPAYSYYGKNKQIWQQIYEPLGTVKEIHIRW